MRSARLREWLNRVANFCDSCRAGGDARLCDCDPAAWRELRGRRFCTERPRAVIAAVVLAAATAVALRIVSLAPSLTEDLFAIGAGSSVVAVDAYSDRPAAARRLPRVGSMRTINSEAIAGLDPDLVVGIPYQTPSLRDLNRVGVRTQILPADTLGDDFSAILTLGRLTGRMGEAARVLATIRHRLAAAARATRALPAPRVLVVIGVAPIYTAGQGSYINDLFAIAHLRNVARDARAAYPALSAETVEAADPDMLVLPSGTVIPDEPPWSRLRAVRDRRVVMIAEDDLLRPGPRVADVVDALVRGVARFRRCAPGEISGCDQRGRTGKAYPR